MKNLFKLTLSIFLVVLGANTSFAQLTFWNDLYLYYPLNGTGLDLSGNNIHGQALEVTPTTGVFNDPDGAFYFNGTNSMVIRNALELGDSVTMAGWFYSEADSLACGLIYNGNTGFSGYGAFVKKPFGSIPNGSWMGKTLVILQGGVNEAYFNNEFELPTNQWKHIAIVRKGPILELYLNGEFQSTAPYLANPPVGEFSVGSSTAHILTGYGSFKGKIDEIMVFRSALQAQDVQRVFISNLTENKPFINEKVEVKILGTTTGSDEIVFVSNKFNLDEVSIVDIKGRTVEIGNSTYGLGQKSYSISKRNLKPGFYIAKAMTSGGSTSVKFIVE
jgi:hypothetical protein